MKRILQLMIGLVIIIAIQSCQNTWQKQVDNETENRVEQALIKAGENSGELQKALEEAPGKQKAGVAFLISYMPDSDLKELTAEFLLENTAWAYKAREHTDIHAAIDSIRAMIAFIEKS